MESSTDFVGLPSKLSPGVQRSHHCLQGRNLGGGVYIYGNAPAVVGHSNTAIIVDDDRDPVTVAGHRLINAVIYDLMNQVVQSALIGAANIHRRPQPYCLQLLQHLNITSSISLLHLSPKSQNQLLSSREAFSDIISPERVAPTCLVIV